MLLVLWDMIQKDPNMKGQKGDPGEFDFAKMPPFVIKFVDKDRQSVEERPFVFSRERNRFEVEFDPIHVQNFDATAKPDSKPIDEEKYPYPGPIKLRHGAKVPAKTGPTT